MYARLVLQVLFFVFLSCKVSFAQLDSINTPDGYRTYIVHLPTGYTSSNSYPLVLCLHGLNSSASQQKAYAGFDAVADTGKFIIVYPNGLNNAWNISTGSPNDVNFLSSLIDTLKKDFSINPSCVYSSGMSNGGFMSYVLACSLSTKIAAVGIVAGNMVTLQKSFCNPSKGIPVIHMHGTSDLVVSYNGTTGITNVPSTVKWWVNENTCDTAAITTTMPDLNTTDGCTVDRFYYGNGKDNSEVLFYRINGGGHTWPSSSVPAPILGNTCYDISASGELWNFFRKQCLKTTSINEHEPISLEIYPNPVIDNIQVKFSSSEGSVALQIFDVLGNKLIDQQLSSVNTTLNVNMLPSGHYFIRINGKSSIVSRFVKINQE